jgi:hypothetical protein
MVTFSVSLADIEDHLVDYFCDRFHASPATVFPATNVYKDFNFKPAAWRELADALSALPWMQHIGVVLVQADMVPLTTIEQIAYLIFKRIKQVVTTESVVGAAVPLSALMKASLPRARDAASRGPSAKPAARKKKAARRNK